MLNRYPYSARLKLQTYSFRGGEQEKDGCPGVLPIQVKVWDELGDILVVGEVLHRGCGTEYQLDVYLAYWLKYFVFPSARGWHALLFPNGDLIGLREETTTGTVVSGCLPLSIHARGTSHARSIITLSYVTVFVGEVLGNFPMPQEFQAV